MEQGERVLVGLSLSILRAYVELEMGSDEYETDVDADEELHDGVDLWENREVDADAGESDGNGDKSVLSRANRL